MNGITVLVVVAFAATVLVLGLGLRSMAHGGQEDRKQSTLLMRRRVIFQAIAFGLILFAVVTALN